MLLSNFNTMIGMCTDFNHRSSKTVNTKYCGFLYMTKFCYWPKTLFVFLHLEISI